MIDGLEEIDHPHHWYITLSTHPSSVSAILATARQQFATTQTTQVIHNHDAAYPCTKGCYSIP